MPKYGRFLFLLLVISWLGWGGTPTFSAPAAPPLGPQVTLLADGLQLEWQAQELRQQPQPDGTVTLTMPDFGMEQAAGLPGLPVASVLLALPPTAVPTLLIEETAVSERPFSGQLSINPQPEGVLRDEAGNAIAGNFVLAEPLPVTTPTLSLTEAGLLRGVRLARLTFAPVQIADNRLQLTETVTATVQFNTPAAAVGQASAAKQANQFDLLQQSLMTQVINPTQLIVNQPQAQLAKPATAAPIVLIEVAQPGITAVTYQNLLNAGFPVGSINPANLQLWYDGLKRPLEWFGDGDAQFEAGESFRFYAAPWFSRWMVNDVYTLTEESSPGSRIASQSASPTGLTNGTLTLTAVAEENDLYTPDCLCGQLSAGRDGDRWVWQDLRQPGRPSASYPIDLPYADNGKTAEMTLWAIGFTNLDANPDHNLDMTLNGTGLGRVSWDGKTAVTHTVTIPAGSLQSSSSLALSIPVIGGVSIDGLWLDGFAVDYSYDGSPIAANEQLFAAGAAARRAYSVSLSSSAGLRLYDVTNAAAPALLTNTVWQNGQVSWGDPNGVGHSYLVSSSSSLLTPAAVRLPVPLPSDSGADYLVISYADFLPALTPLLALRQSQGMAVTMVDVQAIYDNFGYGRLTPEAIRSYLSTAYQSWTPAPTYVLLVGDGTSDPKQYRDDSQATWLPPYLADVDPWAGETAADNRFVMLDGADVLPDMLIGRLPVNNLDQAQTVVDKIVGYEATPFLGDWNGRFTFISDDTDAAGNFAAKAASLEQNYVPDPWQVTSINYDSSVNSVTDLQSAIKQSWQNGPGLMMYTGHSSIHQWGAERFFHLDDVPTLANGARLPILLQMTCLTGSFQQPFWDTLDESLLRQPGGGAVAVWGSTGLGVGTGHSALAAGFFDALLLQNELRLGTAVLAGKLNLLTNQPANQDLLDTFTLFGDPATQFNTDLWTGLQTFLPAVSR